MSKSLETPMMRQYLEVKAQQPDAVLLMRMGDFYEAFLSDAEELARVCGVALTSRNKDDPQPVAMAGIPHHQLPNYLPKLIAAGRRVAVMDQLEEPAVAAKEGRAIRRGLTRVVTAGTLVEDDQLSPGEANYLVACTGLDPQVQPVGVAALDVSTGRFTVEEASSPSQLALILARLAPAELVLPDACRDAPQLPELITPVPPVATLAAFAWKGGDARRYLAERLRVASLDGFDIAPEHDHLAAAAAAALRYAENAVAPDGNGRAVLTHLRSLTRLRASQGLVLDATCRRNLDLVRNSRDGTRAGTLLSAIDRTRTAPGARLLAEWLTRPLADLPGIRHRHDAVGALVADDGLRHDLRDALGTVYDLERLLGRIATGRAHARDLVHLAASLEAAARLGSLLAGRVLPALLADAQTHLAAVPDVAAIIRRTLVDDPPLTMQDGGLVRDGIDAEVDEFRAIKRDAGAWLATYQAQEAARLGIKTLKVGYNSVFGYYIELSKSVASQAPADYHRKQTLVNAERFITPALKEYEDKALGAEDRLRVRELALFHALRQQAEAATPRLQLLADHLAAVDVLAALAEIARLGAWCRPDLDEGLGLSFTALRHPVVEASLGRGRFVANDTYLDARPEPCEDADSGADRARAPRLAIITGPNMAGKSTYIRQVAVAVILAQAGAFVPATSAHVGVVDRVFTRVGAGDELARNLSTFMVEMAETAAILHHATKRSLVILDEVGRGTSTFDGVSLAWAITEHLHDRVGCRCLFATHYHELTDLAHDRPSIGNLTVAVAEHDDDVVFLHRIEPGAAAKSYGIHVARIAGVPAPVIARAREVLQTLESLNTDLTARESAHRTTALPSPAPAALPPNRPAGSAPVQLTIFGGVSSPTLDRLKTVDLDSLSPRAAWDLLAELQRAAKRE